MDEPQAEFLSYEEVTMLRNIAARMQDKMWPNEHKFHAQGVTITFALDKKEE